MWYRLISFACAAVVSTGSLSAGDLTRGLTITGGGNALATLNVERVGYSAAGDGILTLRVSVGRTRDVTGYGFSLHYDPATCEFLEARELEGNLLQMDSGRETLFLASDRTPGRVDVAAARVDGGGVSGDGVLVELVFRAVESPASSDFRISESVLIGVDGAVDLLARVEVSDMEPLPDRFRLEQNAPNPFNPATVIRYQLAEAAQVRLAVYNVLGQEVRLLVNEPKEAGAFAVTWDGTDEWGRRVSSGIYLYRIQADDFSAARRMLLLK